MDPNTVINKKIRRNMSRRTRILLFTGVFMLLAAAVAFGLYYYKSGKTEKNTVAQQTATVQKGNLSISVKGSGPVGASNRYDLTSNVAGIIRKVYFKDGDTVKAGDLIMELDDDAALIDIKKLENNIAQAQLEQEDNAKDLESSVVLSPISGEVTELLVKTGDNIGSNASLLTIMDKSKLRLLVPFSNTYRKDLKNGQEVTVNAFDTVKEELHVIKGTISNISETKFAVGDGEEAYNVEVLINNTGKLTEGMIANVEAVVSGNKLRSAESGTLSYYDSITVKSGSGGTVARINVVKGQYIKSGTVLAEVANDELVLTKETNTLQIEDLQNQLSSAAKQLTYYKVYAPIDGTLFMEDLMPGVTVKAGDPVCSVSNYNSMEFEVPVDELDIAKIAVGQQVKVTVDALAETESKPLSGVVNKIAIEGTSSNGVTTYPVTIQVNETEKLKGGMNANAEIMVESRENALYIPIQGLQKRGQRSVVWVKAEDGQKQNSANNSINGNSAGGQQNANNSSNSNSGNQNRQSRNGGGTAMSAELQKYYANAVMRPVEVGIHNEDYIEIVSGLKEGEVILLPPVSAGQSSSQQRTPTGGMAIPMGGGTFRRN